MRRQPGSPVERMAPREAARAGTDRGSPAMRQRGVLHITPSIGGGGAETMLCDLVERMQPGSWRSALVTVDGRPWPERAALLRRCCEEYHDLAADAFLRPRVLWRLRRIIRQVRPDVVQTWMHHADLLGGLSAWLAGVRRIVWGIHCREIHRNPGDSDARMALFRRAIGLVSRIVPARIVSCSMAAIEDHVKLGYPRAKMDWIPNGVSTERFVIDAQAGMATRRELGIPPDVPVIGYVGRFHEMKNLPVLLVAAGLLQHSMPEAHVILLGGAESELDEKSRDALDGLPDRSRVRFLPFRSDVEKVYPAFSVFTLSSRTEACPMTVLEAMACGVPCITTDVGDCARLIGATGRVVTAGDAESLAAAWQEFLRMPAALRTDLGRSARSRVEKKFNIATAARRYEMLYEHLLED